jgi:hypothetical protein
LLQDLQGIGDGFIVLHGLIIVTEVIRIDKRKFVFLSDCPSPLPQREGLLH